jgi:uncharacterized coiled-coil DUF342 family protein
MIGALLLRLAPYKLAFEIAIFGALAAAVLYGTHELLEHERDIGRNEVRAEYAKQLAEAKDAARLREQQLQSQVDEANQHARERDQTIQALAARAGVSASSLRDTIAAVSHSLSGASENALRDAASTYRDLFEQCNGRRHEMAGQLEEANSDKKTLIEAWPKNAPGDAPSR